MIRNSSASWLYRPITAC